MGIFGQWVAKASIVQSVVAEAFHLSFHWWSLGVYSRGCWMSTKCPLNSCLSSRFFLTTAMLYPHNLLYWCDRPHLISRPINICGIKVLRKCLISLQLCQHKEERYSYQQPQVRNFCSLTINTNSILASYRGRGRTGKRKFFTRMSHITSPTPCATLLPYNRNMRLKADSKICRKSMKGKQSWTAS